MDRIFLDTSFLLAFIDEEDDHHEKARKTMEQSLEGELYISDHIFVEAVNIVYSRTNHQRAQNFAEYLLKSEIDMIQLSQPGFQKAYKIFRTEDLSFTDCTVKASMETLGLEKLATFDEDFKIFENIEIVDQENE